MNVPWKNRNGFLFATVFLLVSVLGVLNHEPWRDEVQGWLIVIRSNSLSEVLHHIAYEGHPFLWYLLLYCGSVFTHDILFVQLLSIGIATTGVLLFYQYSPFTTWQKILFGFGYIPLYQFGIMARSYGLILLWCVLFMIWFVHNRETLWGALILILMANTAATGVVLSLGFMVLFFYREFMSQKENNFKGVLNIIRLHVKFLLLCGIGVALAVWQIYPERDNFMGAGFAFAGFKIAFATVSDSYFWLANWADISGWTGVLWNDRASQNLILSIVIFALLLVLFYPYRLALFLYATGTIGLVCLLGLTGTLSDRFIGHFFIVLICAVWLVKVEGSVSFGLLDQFLGKAFSQRALNIIISCMLTVQFCTGIATYMYEIKRPFSNAAEASRFLRNSEFSDAPVTGGPNFLLSPFSYWLEKDVCFVESQSSGSYMVWSRKLHTSRFSMEKLCLNVNRLLQDDSNVIVVLSSGGQYNDSLLHDGVTHKYLDKDVKVKLLKNFSGARVPDENFSVYVAAKITMPNLLPKE